MIELSMYKFFGVCLNFTDSLIEHKWTFNTPNQYFPFNYFLFPEVLIY